MKKMIRIADDNPVNHKNKREGEKIMKLKKMMAILMSVSFVVASLAGCGNKTSGDAINKDATSAKEEQDKSDEKGGEGFKIGFSNPVIGNAWRASFLESAETTLEEYKEQGIVSDYIISSCDNDATEQLNQVNQMISAGCDAIVINPLSASSMNAVIQDAIDEGIVVVVCNDLIAVDGTLAITNSQSAYGDIAGRFITDYYKDTTDEVTMVTIPGVVGVTSANIRSDALDAVLATNENINVVASAPGSWSATETQSVMSTFCSTYPEINAVYTEEGGEGVIYACENAGHDMPEVMNGDYTYLFFKLWQQYGLNACTTPSDTSISSAGIHLAILELQGYEIDESKLEANLYDENLINTIYLDPPYIVTNDGTADFLGDDYSEAKILSLDEALEMCEGQEDSFCLSIPVTREQIATYFK